MIVYFDTSALVPIVIEESTSTAVSRLWLEADRVVSSRLIYAEAHAAAALAQRAGRLRKEELREVVSDLESLVGAMDMVEVTDALVRRAGALAETFGLRGYDAVHLASAELLGERDLVVAAGHQILLKAARALGLGVANLYDARP